MFVKDDLGGVPLGVNVQNQRRRELRRVLQLCCDMKKHEVKIARPMPNSETLAAFVVVTETTGVDRTEFTDSKRWNEVLKTTRRKTVGFRDRL